jgi:O-antigen/teichoic acid export membrane protein
MAPAALAELASLAGLTLHLLLLRAGLDAAGALYLFAFWFLLRALVLLALLPLWLPALGAAGTPLRLTKRQLADYWVYSLPLRWLGLAYFELDRYVIGLVAALELVALFHVPARLVGVSKRFLAAPVLAFQTEVSRLYEERREAELGRRLRLLVRGQLAISLWLAAALFLVARPLILLLSTETYLAALPLLGLLLITLPLGSLAAALEAALRGLDGLGAVLIGNLLWALAYYGALPWFIGRWGLLGLGIAQVLAAALQAVAVMIAAARRGWLAGATGELLRAASWALVPVVVAFAAAGLWPGRRGLQPAPPGMLLGLALLALLAGALLRGGGLVDAEEKAWLLGRLPRAGLRRPLAWLLGVQP